MTAASFEQVDGRLAWSGTAADLRDLPAPAWCVPDLLQEDSTAVLWGHPGAFKTTHLIDIGARIALGWRWRDRRCAKGVVLLCPLEDLPGFAARVAAWETYHKVDLAVRAPWFRWWRLPFDFSHDQAARINVHLTDLCDQYGMPARLLAPDPLMAGFGAGTPNEDKDMRPRLEAVRDMRKGHPACCCLVGHHCAWAGEHEAGSYTLRALTATSIKATAGAGVGELEVVRQKNAAGGDRFGVKVISVGNSLILEPGIVPAPAAPLTGRKLTLFEIVREAMPEGLTTEEVNAKAREIKLASTSNLWTLRKQLSTAGHIHETQGRWFVTRK